MNSKDFESGIKKLLTYVGDAAIGPSISALLEKFVITNSSEQLVAFIYFLGFTLSAFRIWLSVKHRKLEFLEKMVYRKQKKDGEELEGGIIDANSVGVIEWVSKI